MQRRLTWFLSRLYSHITVGNRRVLALQMREIAEIELAIQGGTEKIETLGTSFLPGSSVFVNADFCVGEQGKVEESMKEMQAIEALKSEKSDKEVCR